MKIKNLVLSLTIIFIVFSCIREKTELKLNLKQGETYKFKQEINQEIKQTMMGTEQNMSTKMGGVISFYIKEKLKDTMVVDVCYEKMVVNIKTPMMNIEYNSEKPLQKDDLLGLLFSYFVGKKFQIVINSFGEIVDVSGTEQIFSQMYDSVPIENPQEKGQMINSVESMLGKESFKASLEMITMVFPKKPVSVGSKWNSKVNLKANLSTDITNEWQLKEKTNEYIVIAGKSKMTTAESDSNAMTVMPIKYNLNGSQDALLKLDVNTGWVIKADISSSMKGKLIIEKNEQAPDGLEIPVELNTKTVVEVIK